MRPRYRTRYMRRDHPMAHRLGDCPNAGPHPNVWGMKNMYWGMDAKCVRSGAYVYNVTRRPELYEHAH